MSTSMSYEEFRKGVVSYGGEDRWRRFALWLVVIAEIMNRGTVRD